MAIGFGMRALARQRAARALGMVGQRAKLRVALAHGQKARQMRALARAATAHANMRTRAAARVLRG